MISKLRWAFGLESETIVEEALREENTYSMLTSMLSGKGKPRIFFFYQPQDIEVEGEMVQGTGEPFLFGTDGLSVKLRGRCVWFMRKEGDKQVVLDQANDGLVTFGVLDDGVLHSVESVLSTCYAPSLGAKKIWDKADPVYTKKFVGRVDDFVRGMQSSLKSMTTGLELRKPDAQFENSDGGQGFVGLSTSSDWEMVGHYVDLLDEWCLQTESYLEEGAHRQWESPDAGPDTELEYWRRRMQRLLSITEQIKTKECKTVIGVLSAVTKANPAEMRVDRQRLFALLRRWRQIDINITEAANEAKDNVKYLQTLEKFIDPLYRGTPQTVIDALPALLNSIKMIHTIARYYNTTERMTTLFVKITNQMITNCCQHIAEDKPIDDMWNREPGRTFSWHTSAILLNLLLLLLLLLLSATVTFPLLYRWMTAKKVCCSAAILFLLPPKTPPHKKKMMRL